MPGLGWLNVTVEVSWKPQTLSVVSVKLPFALTEPLRHAEEAPFTLMLHMLVPPAVTVEPLLESV